MLCSVMVHPISQETLPGELTIFILLALFGVSLVKRRQSENKQVPQTLRRILTASSSSPLAGTRRRSEVYLILANLAAELGEKLGSGHCHGVSPLN